MRPRMSSKSQVAIWSFRDRRMSRIQEKSLPCSKTITKNIFVLLLYWQDLLFPMSFRQMRPRMWSKSQVAIWSFRDRRMSRIQEKSLPCSKTITKNIFVLLLYWQDLNNRPSDLDSTSSTFGAFFTSFFIGQLPIQGWDSWVYFGEFHHWIKAISDALKNGHICQVLRAPEYRAFLSMIQVMSAR